jgi:hypothetical protein
LLIKEHKYKIKIIKLRRPHEIVGLGDAEPPNHANVFMNKQIISKLQLADLRDPSLLDNSSRLGPTD